MSLEAWKAFFEIGGVVLLLLTFAFGAGALIVNNRLNATQAKELGDFRIKFEEEQQKTALAQKEVAEAKITLATVNERTLTLQKAATDAKAAQQKVEIDLGEQKEKTADAEKSLLELQIRMQPRRISPEQRARLIAILAQGPKGKVSINCVLGDGEGHTFANDIDDVLKASGWETTGVNQAVFGGGGNPVGFFLRIHDAVTAPPSAVLLQRAFFSVGLPIDGVVLPSLTEGTIEILVGNKPQL